MNFWQCLNYLVPNPDCDTRGNEVTSWRDARPQPTLEECEAVWPIVQAKMLVPKSISPAQLRVWLITNGVPMASIGPAIDALPISDLEKEAAKARWEYSLTIERDNVLVTTLAAALGMTDAQIDQAFIEAAKL